MTKALMEKLAINKSRDPRTRESGTVICATRYGNVMCSRGSIIPLFIEQIKTGKPMTVTVPEMTRFMMSLDEAVNLVMPILAICSYRKPLLPLLKFWLRL